MSGIEADMWNLSTAQSKGFVTTDLNIDDKSTQGTRVFQFLFWVWRAVEKNKTLISEVNGLWKVFSAPKFGSATQKNEQASWVNWDS